MKRKNTIESAQLYSSFLFISSAKLKQNNKILIHKKKKKRKRNVIPKKKKRKELTTKSDAVHGQA